MRICFAIVITFLSTGDSKETACSSSQAATIYRLRWKLLELNVKQESCES